MLRLWDLDIYGFGDLGTLGFRESGLRNFDIQRFRDE